MMTKTALCLPFLLLPFLKAFTQTAQPCGADELRISTLRQLPEVAKAVAGRENALERHTAEYTAHVRQRGGDDEVYLIPMVFHVIHQFGDENISDAQLKDGLRVLNSTFRKTYPDTADIIPAFKPIHADCGIEFRLASKDPDGNCHPGINRIASGLGTTGGHEVKSLVHWDPQRYLNVYVVSNAAGLAGHAVWPSDADTIPAWDGIVMSHNYMGSIGTSDPTRSVVFAHECGHYLNLHHIWGGNNVPGFYYLPVGQAANCQHDDLVDDTPNTIGHPQCNLSAASCGNTVDNVQNVMDYSYCNIMFTQGQRDRMRACLNSPIAGRSNLWQAANLIATGVLPEPAPLCAADFTVSRAVVCAGDTDPVVFTSTSYHATPDSYDWEFPGGSPSVSTAVSPGVTYAQPGVFGATLRVGAGPQAAEAAKPAQVTVLSNEAVPYPFADSFEESGQTAGPLWYGVASDGNGWEWEDAAAHYGSRCLALRHHGSAEMRITELYSPAIDLSGVADPKIFFRYATTSAGSALSDRLQLFVRKDCQSAWVQRMSITGSQLRTAAPVSGPFVPQSGEEWALATVSIPSSAISSDFRFKVVHTYRDGNNFFIDDIQVDAVAGISAQARAPMRLRIYPNPSAGHLRWEAADIALRTDWQLTDMTGRWLAGGTVPAGQLACSADLTGLACGTYLLHTRAGQHRASAMVQIMPTGMAE